MKKLRYLLSPLALGMLFLLVILLLANPDTVRDAAADALSLCAVTVIPVLFPFLALSSLLIAADAFSAPVFRIFRPLTRLLRLPDSACGPLLIGSLCGFPLGAASAAALYHSGGMTAHQAERLTALAHNTGPAFIVGLCGSVLFRSREFGLFLYAVQLLSALLVGLLLSRLCPDPPERPRLCAAPALRKSLSAAFPSAVSSAAASMLSVCGTVVLFRVLAAVLVVRIPLLQNGTVGAFFSALLECTGGLHDGAALGGSPGAAAAGLAVGWSGLSVLLQCRLFAAEDGLSLRLCVLTKAVQGVLCAAAAGCFAANRRLLLRQLPRLEVDYRLLTALELALLAGFILVPALVSGLRTGRQKRENEKSS